MVNIRVIIIIIIITLILSVLPLVMFGCIPFLCPHFLFYFSPSCFILFLFLAVLLSVVIRCYGPNPSLHVLACGFIFRPSFVAFLLKRIIRVLASTRFCLLSYFSSSL